MILVSVESFHHILWRRPYLIWTDSLLKLLTFFQVWTCPDQFQLEQDLTYCWSCWNDSALVGFLSFCWLIMFKIINRSFHFHRIMQPQSWHPDLFFFSSQTTKWHLGSELSQFLNSTRLLHPIHHINAHLVRNPDFFIAFLSPKTT